MSLPVGIYVDGYWETVEKIVDALIEAGLHIDDTGEMLECRDAEDNEVVIVWPKHRSVAAFIPPIKGRIVMVPMDPDTFDYFQGKNWEVICHWMNHKLSGREQPSSTQRLFPVIS